VPGNCLVHYGNKRGIGLRVLLSERTAGEEGHSDRGKVARSGGNACRDVQCDEIWGFVQKKEAHKWPWEAHDFKIGDAYCFVAIDRHTKLVLTHLLGRRTNKDTDRFIRNLRCATAPQQFQITTEGFKPYIDAIINNLSDRADYAQLIKIYATSHEGERRYSPADVVEAVPKVMMGDPDEDKICTSHVERQNLTIRMQMRRMTRLTNGFSKKWENLKAAYALHFAYYNFCRIHSTLRITPAMAAGITDHVWNIHELLMTD
jgi:IS1 family transposase